MIRFSPMTVIFILAACSQPVPAPPVPEVAVAATTSATVPIVHKLTGRVVPLETAEVRPQVSGIVMRKFFTEGTFVEKGTPLYQVDNAPFEAALQGARARLSRAQATVQSARLRSDRLVELAGRSSASPQEADDAKAVYAEARAAVQQAQAEAQSAAIDAGRTTIRAPISGRIGRSMVTVGALVTAGQPMALSEIYRTDSVYVDITQAATTLLNRPEGSTGPAVNQASVKVWTTDRQKPPYIGRLLNVDPAVNAETGTVTLRAMFPNASGELMPGLFVRAELTMGSIPNAVLVPQAAVARDPMGHPFVLIVGKDKKVEVRTLTLGILAGDVWTVKAGLKTGDLVVMEGAQRVQPGMVVRTKRIKPDVNPTSPGGAAM